MPLPLLASLASCTQRPDVLCTRNRAAMKVSETIINNPEANSIDINIAIVFILRPRGVTSSWNWLYEIFFPVYDTLAPKYLLCHPAASEFARKTASARSASYR